MKAATPSDGPSVEDLALAEIKGSHLFGLTNTAGKVLTAIEAGMLTIPTLGLAQMFGHIGAVAGLTISPVIGIAFAAASIGVGLTAYALGNFDDKKITQYNDTQYDLRENFRGAALDTVDSYRPSTREELLHAVQDGVALNRQLQQASATMMIANSNNGASGGWGDGDSGDKKGLKLDKDSAQGLVYGAAIAAAAASYITFGFAAWKNFIDKAPKIDTTGAERRARKSVKRLDHLLHRSLDLDLLGLGESKSRPLVQRVNLKL